MRGLSVKRLCYEVCPFCKYMGCNGNCVEDEEAPRLRATTETEQLLLKVSDDHCKKSTVTSQRSEAMIKCLDLLHAHYKYFDSLTELAYTSLTAGNPFATTPFTMTTANAGGCLNCIPTGTQLSGRNGKKVDMVAVHIRIVPRAGQLGAVTGVRFALLWDRFPNKGATIPAPSAIWAGVAGVGALANVNGVSRFQTIREWTFVVGANGNVSPTIDQLIDLRRTTTTWATTDTGGLYSAMLTNALLLRCVGTDSGYTCTISTRVFYDDFQD